MIEFAPALPHKPLEIRSFYLDLAKICYGRNGGLPTHGGFLRHHDIKVWAKQGRFSLLGFHEALTKSLHQCQGCPMLLDQTRNTRDVLRLSTEVDPLGETVRRLG